MWPKTFHRIWFDEPERPEFAEWRERLAELHPDWTVRTWGSSAEVRALIDDPRLRDEWDRYIVDDPFGRIPDIARYLILWHHGGIYVDTDCQPLRPMDELLEDPRPFAGWENDRTMCTAVLAAPPKHPAIGILLDGLVDRLKATVGKPANEAVGPEYATALWREREDVRRLPPWAFYAIGWWERHKLGRIEPPARSYLLHWWNKGWGKATKPVRVAARADHPSLSVLVAWRDTDGSRSAAWELIRDRFAEEMPEAELVIGTDDGDEPFHKTVALNRAAAEARGDVFLVTDADTWVDPDRVWRAVEEVAADPKSWYRPWNIKVKLNEAATDHVLGQGSGWDGTLDHRAFGRPEHRNGFRHCPPLVLHSEAWETVGGFDERFRGWGQEDLAFSLAMTRLVGQQKTIPGNALHLWHPRRGRSGSDLWNGQDSQASNIALAQEYRRARTPAAMRELIEMRQAVAA